MTATKDGLVVCSDTRGVKSDGTEIKLQKLFIVNPDLVFGATGDTEYFADGREVFDTFTVAERYLRGIETLHQIPGLGDTLRGEFRPLVTQLRSRGTSSEFQVVTVYVDHEQTPFLYSAKVSPDSTDIKLHEQHRGGRGSVFFKVATLSAFGVGDLINELQSGKNPRFNDLRANKALMDIVSLKRFASSLMTEEAISLQRLVIRETSRRIDPHKVSEQSRCLLLPYRGGAVWR